MKKTYLLTFVISLIIVYLAASFHGKLSEFKSLGLLGIFIINLIGNATVFLPTPAIASVIAGGMLYPLILVAIVSALGAAIGDMVGFILGRSSKEILIKNHHRWYIFLRDMFKTHGTLIILIFALIPNPFFDAVGILAGIFAFPPVYYFVLVFLGRFIRNILLANLGAHL